MPAGDLQCGPHGLGFKVEELNAEYQNHLRFFQVHAIMVTGSVMGTGTLNVKPLL